MVSFDHIQDSIKLYSPLIQFIVLIVSGIWFVWQAAYLPKLVDAYRHQLQVDFLKTELRAKQLYSIYPELFAKLKYAEKEIGYLFGTLLAEKINPTLTNWDKRAKISAEAKDEAEDCLRKNLLFLSHKVKRLSLKVEKKIDELFVMCLSRKVYDNAKIEDKKYLEELQNIMQLLEEQMQSELEGTQED